MTSLFSSTEDEEMLYATQTVENTSGADQAAMYSIPQMRFVWIEGQGMWVRCIVTAGSSGSNYTLSLLSRFAGPINGSNAIRPVIDTRIGVKIRDNRLLT
jgi:hypothetical protein